MPYGFLDAADEPAMLAAYQAPIVFGQLAHCSFTLPVRRFQLPSTRSQFMAGSPHMQMCFPALHQ
jgi:hypothetical protein